MSDFLDDWARQQRDATAIAAAAASAPPLKVSTAQVAALAERLGILPATEAMKFLRLGVDMGRHEVGQCLVYLQGCAEAGPLPGPGDWVLGECAIDELWQAPSQGTNA